MYTSKFIILNALLMYPESYFLCILYYVTHRPVGMIFFFGPAIYAKPCWGGGGGPGACSPGKFPGIRRSLVHSYSFFRVFTHFFYLQITLFLAENLRKTTLNLSQTTNFRLFQIEKGCRRKNQI